MIKKMMIKYKELINPNIFPNNIFGFYIIGMTTHLCIPAADRMLDSKSRMYQPKLHMIVINSKKFDVIESITKDAHYFFMTNVRPDDTGTYSATWTRTKSSRGAEKKTYVEGAIEIINKELHQYLTEKYQKLIADYKPVTVTYGTLNPKKVTLYPAFDLELIEKC